MKDPRTNEQQLKDLLYRERALIYNLIFNLHQQYPSFGYDGLARRIRNLSDGLTEPNSSVTP